MNTEITVHPMLQHYGLTTANLDAMIGWYHKVLGMTVNYRAAVPPDAQSRAPFSGGAFLSNDEVHHRIVFFEIPGVMVDTDKSRHVRLHHIAFAYDTMDDLLGSHARLKGLGILPLWAADHGVGISFYYQDPDQNVVGLNVSNYGSEWTATEHMKTLPGFARTPVDPDKMLAARKAGASPWEIHERAIAGELAPAKPHDPGARF